MNEPLGVGIKVDSSLTEIEWAHAIPIVTHWDGCNRRCGRPTPAVSPSGDVVIAGGLNYGADFPLEQGSLRFMPDKEEGYLTDVSGYIMHFDSTGRLLGGFQLADKSELLTFNDVTWVGDRTVLLAGFFRYRVDFDPDPYRSAYRYSESYGSGFLLRTDPLGTMEITVGTEGFRHDVPREGGLSLHPNPTRGSARISLTVPVPQSVTVELFDVVGRRIDVLFDGMLSESTTFEVDITRRLGGTSSGLYFVRAQGKDLSSVRSIVILK